MYVELNMNLIRFNIKLIIVNLYKINKSDMIMQLTHDIIKNSYMIMTKAGINEIFWNIYRIT